MLLQSRRLDREWGVWYVSSIWYRELLGQYNRARSEEDAREKREMKECREEKK